MPPCSSRSRRRDGGRGEDVEWAVGRHPTNRALLDSAHHFPSDRIMLAAVCADHGEKQVTGWRDIRANVQLLPNRNLSDKEGTSYDRQHLLNPEYAAHPGDLTSSGPLEKPIVIAYHDPAVLRFNFLSSCSRLVVTRPRPPHSNSRQGFSRNGRLGAFPRPLHTGQIVKVSCRFTAVMEAAGPYPRCSARARSATTRCRGFT